ncbi:DNA repair protein RadA, partial [Bacillus tequilensis]|nr:DNA repair protein RadA [Bacillus tequilensis]
VKEAAMLGFQRLIIPGANLDGWPKPKGIEVIGVANVAEALRTSSGGF